MSNTDTHDANLLTDRDLIIATFNAVGVLAKALTGKTLVVEAGDPDKDTIKIYAGPFDAVLTDDLRKAAASQPIVHRSV
jgi:hypothetical protein